MPLGVEEGQAEKDAGPGLPPGSGGGLLRGQGPGCLLTKALRSGVVPSPPGGEPAAAARLISLFFPPRFHSFASGPSVLETKSNTALKIMTPNILIAPFGDKVTGTALYHRTLQPGDDATGTFIFRETAAAALEPDVPSGCLPQADILKPLGGDRGEQHRRGGDPWPRPGGCAKDSGPGSQRLHLPRRGQRARYSRGRPGRGERLAEGGADGQPRPQPADPRPASKRGRSSPSQPFGNPHRRGKNNFLT